MRKLWLEIRFYVALCAAIVEFDILYYKMKKKGQIIWN